MVGKINQNCLVRMFKDIQRTHSDERFCFLIGAGASKSSGIKTGWELSKEWYDDIKNDLDETELIKWQNNIKFNEEKIGEFYPCLYRKRYESSPEIGYAEFKYMMENVDPGLGYVILSQILAKEKHNFVITTNFDYLIEDAVRMYTSTKPFSAGHEILAEFISTQTERPTIIKVHRDLFLHPFSDEDETKKLKEEWKKALTPILKNFNLLVIGYGGNDGSLMDYLKEIKPQDRKPIYWCTRNNNNLNSKIEELLTKKDFIVTISGFDGLMFALNKALDYHVFKDLDKPENHQFVLSAKKRIETLNAKRQKLLEDFSEDKEIPKATKAIFTGSFKYLIDAFSEKDIDKKEQIYKNGLLEYPKYPDLMGAYATFLSDIRKDDDKAEEYYKKAIELDPNSANNIGNYAIFLKNIRKDYDEAEEYYKKAIELDPNSANKIGNYAIFLKNIRKNYDEAEEYYKKVIELKPDDADFIGNYAIFLSDIRKDYDEAEKYYKKAIELDPNSANKIGNYAHHLIVSKQDFANAEKYINKAFRLSEDSMLELEIELWFYRYAHYKKWYGKAENELDKLIKQDVKSLGWNLQSHIEIAEKNGHPNLEKVKEYANLIVK